MRWRNTLAALALIAAAAAAHADGAWPDRLRDALAAVDRAHRAELGVHVRELGGSAAVSHRADEAWYLASMVKVPIAVAVLRGVAQGRFTLDTPLALRAADLVDGAGETDRHAVGAKLPIRFLLEQMLIHSDNTASDMLIARVGLDTVNTVAQSLVPGGFGPITALADVRRQVYARLAPAGLALQGHELQLLARQRGDLERLRLFARLAELPPDRFEPPALAAAYEAYFASGLNSGRLDAVADLLVQVAEGRALDPAGTAFLLDAMERAATGARRIKAGLPPGVRFAHKTGTQRGRVCDAGVVQAPSGRRLVVAACTRGEPSLQRAERALQAVGGALVASGALDATAPATP